MVHRPADSRLLTNLLQHEKEYSKQLNQFLETSCASLASLAAYAAASPPPVSHVIMELTATLAAADAALKRYSFGVDEWRETMRALKDAEDEVGNIMRDREILVTRLIKASKSQKNGTGSIRESLLLGPQRFPSSSSLSLSVNGQPESPSPTPSRPLSLSFSTSSKLAAAQSELQACESHLAAKERELAQKRCSAVRDGLGVRIRALVDCGWVWNELGKEALRSLDELRNENSDQNQPRVADSARPSSDLSSIGPSQSVSQVNSMHNAPPPVSMSSIMNSGIFGDLMPNNNSNGAQNDANGERPLSGSSAGSLATPSTYQVQTITYAPAVPLYISGKDAAPAPEHEPPKSDYTTMHIPPPHALEGYTYGYPTAAPSATHSETNSEYSTPSGTPQRQNSLTSPPLISAFHRHTLERRITEEEIRRRSLNANEDASSAEGVQEDEKLVQEGKLAVVENPRFMTEARKKELEKDRDKKAREEEERARKEGERVRKEEEKARKEKGQQKSAVDVDRAGLDEMEGEGREKKRFSFFHQPKIGHNQSQSSPTKRWGPIPPIPDANDTGDQSSLPKTSKATNVSPSKGFFGSIKHLFTPSASPSHAGTAKRATADDEIDHELSDSDRETSPMKSSRGGLFRSGGDGKLKAGRWQTRTDKNLKEITRKGSFDGDSQRVTDVGLGTSIAGRAVANVGIGTSSGVGSSTSLEHIVHPAPGSVVGPSAKKLKKRAGPPVSGSSAVTTDDVVGPTFQSKTSTAAAPTKTSNRRSASVDTPTQSRRSWGDQDAEIDENGALIVDLGRRRTASEVGKRSPTGTLPATEPAPKLLKSVIRSPTPASASEFGPSKDYASDTAALSGPTSKKKKNLTKKKPQGTTTTAASPIPPVSSFLTPAPTSTPLPRKDSVKSVSPPDTGTKKTALSHSPISNGTVGATIIAAGGDYPTGTLLSEPGWGPRSQTQGGLARHASNASAVSATSGGAGRGRKTTVLGQGMPSSGGVSRRSSLGPAVGGSTAKVDRLNDQSVPQAKATGSLVQPTPSVPSLMSIVEDVARVNREGWNQDKLKKSIGGSQKPTGMIDVVRAPPSMGRKTLEAMEADKMMSKPLSMPAPVSARTSMFEVKAPGSVFDQPQRQEETSKKSRQQVQSVVSAANAPQKQSATYLTPLGSGNVPLRSALRTSRSPSPIAGPPRLQQHDDHMHASPSKLDNNYLPPPVDGILPWGPDGTLQRPRKVDKGKAPMRGPPAEDVSQSGDDTASEAYETGDEMRDLDGENIQASTKRASKPHPEAGPPPTMNGHAIRHEKGSSEVSHVSQLSRSTASTVVVGASGYQQPPLQANAQAQAATQQPRRRKSVRVSLQPTFSPSPPAIEYDDEEEQKQHAPWAWHGDRSSESGHPAPMTLPAPIPVRPNTSPHEPSKINDMWADSDEEDEQYSRAKRLLSRAAKKEKDVSLMVANRAS